MASCLRPLVESLFPDSASLRYPRCSSKLAGDGGAAERASGEGFEAQERRREARADPRAGSGPRREGRRGFGDFVAAGEKGQGS